MGQFARYGIYPLSLIPKAGAGIYKYIEEQDNIIRGIDYYPFEKIKTFKFYHKSDRSSCPGPGDFIIWEEKHRLFDGPASDWNKQDKLGETHVKSQRGWCYYFELNARPKDGTLPSNVDVSVNQGWRSISNADIYELYNRLGLWGE